MSRAARPRSAPTARRVSSCSDVRPEMSMTGRLAMGFLRLFGGCQRCGAEVVYERKVAILDGTRQPGRLEGVPREGGEPLGPEIELALHQGEVLLDVAAEIGRVVGVY